MQDKPSSPEVPLEKLRWRCDPESFPFDTTADLPPLEGIIGQERAQKALALGVEIARAGYNIYVCGCLALAGLPRCSSCWRRARSVLRHHRICATFLPSNILSAHACSPYRLARGRP